MNKILITFLSFMTTTSVIYGANEELEELWKRNQTPPHRIGDISTPDIKDFSKTVTKRLRCSTPPPMPSIPAHWDDFTSSFVSTFTALQIPGLGSNILTILCNTLEQIETYHLANLTTSGKAATRQLIYLEQLKYIAQFTPLFPTSNAGASSSTTFGGNIFIADFCMPNTSNSNSSYFMPFLSFMQARSQLTDAPELNWWQKLCGWKK